MSSNAGATFEAMRMRIVNRQVSAVSVCSLLRENAQRHNKAMYFILALLFGKKTCASDLRGRAGEVGLWDAWAKLPL